MNTKTVPFINLTKQHESLKEEILLEIENLILNSNFIMGSKVQEFEENISNYLNQKSLGCASGSDALLLSLMACDVKQGDEVITTPFTFFATAGTIARLGAKPVFVDIDETLNLDPNKIEEKITSKTKAIIVVHLFGQPAEMDSIMEIALKNNVKIIEDACQAIGSKYKGKMIGTIGDFGCFSFFPTKNLGGMGDGGLVTAKNQKDYDFLKIARLHGSSKKYYHEFVGINSRLDAMQAAILNVKLPHIDAWNTNRQNIAKRYQEELKNVSFPEELDNIKHVYHQFSLFTSKRDELLKHLNENGIAAGVYYPKPLHIQDCFDGIDVNLEDFAQSKKASETILSLPIFPEMTKEEVDYVIETVNNFPN